MFKIFKYLKNRVGRMVIAGVLFMLVNLCNLALPSIMSDIVDNGINKSDFGYIVTASVIMFSVAFIGFLMQIIASRISVSVTVRFCALVREKVFNKVQSLPLEAVDSMGTGALITRTTHDIQMLQWFVSVLMSGLLSIPVLLIGGVALSFSKDVMLSLLFLAFTPLLILTIVLLGRRVRPLYKTSNEYIDKQNSLMRERLIGIRVIRAFNREDDQHNKIKRATEVMAHNIIKANTTMALMHPIGMLLFNLVTLLIVFLGARGIENGSLSVADIIAVIQYIMLVNGAISLSAYVIIMLPRLTNSLSRINEVLDTPSFDRREGKLGKAEGTISIENLSFSFKDSNAPALKNISMDINEGERVAIIGGTGSGKSTLARLIAGFFMPSGGDILFNKTSILDIPDSGVKDSVSFSMQKAPIFDGTIRQNLLMGDKNATDEMLDEVCAIAQIKDYVDSHDLGYEYLLEGGGTNLSGGQKQRFSIARAILKKSNYYIFDDSFSALDYITEAELRKKLNVYLGGKTQIIITQRVASARNCDKIFVLEQGELVGSGTHKELLKKCRIYREIYSSQTGDALNDLEVNVL